MIKKVTILAAIISLFGLSIYFFLIKQIEQKNKAMLEKNQSEILMDDDFLDVTEQVTLKLNGHFTNNLTKKLTGLKADRLAEDYVNNFIAWLQSENQDGALILNTSVGNLPAVRIPKSAFLTIYPISEKNWKTQKVWSWKVMHRRIRGYLSDDETMNAFKNRCMNLIKLELQLNEMLHEIMEKKLDEAK